MGFAVSNCKKSFWSSLIALLTGATFKAMYEARKMKKQEARDDAARKRKQILNATDSLREKIERGGSS